MILDFIPRFTTKVFGFRDISVIKVVLNDGTSLVLPSDIMAKVYFMLKDKELNRYDVDNYPHLCKDE